MATVWICFFVAIIAYFVQVVSRAKVQTAEKFYWGNLKTPRRVMSETPFDFTVSQRANHYRELMKECGNTFAPPIIEYVYRAPLADKLDLSQDFLAWQLQVENDFRERAAVWMQEKYNRVAPAAKEAFAGQYVDFQTVAG